MTVSFEELAPSVDPGAAGAFIRAWHEGSAGHVVLTRISSAGRHVVRSWAFPAGEMERSFTEDGLAKLCADGGGTWNVYVGCSPHRVDPTLGGSRRGGRDTVAAVLGVWLDLDVKEESFASGEEIDVFLETLPFEPTVVADSGSGGRHAYWRLGEEAGVGRDEGERLNEAWWVYVQELAGRAYVDKVATADRIMRLPGTVRWPKVAGESAGPVRLLRDDGPRLARERLWATCEGAWTRLEERRRVTRARAHETMSLAGVTLEGVARQAGWEQLLAVAHLEEIFNRETSWDQILLPHGWVYVGMDSEGRRQWARPGQRGKSAHTDYPLSPHVMKLFSNSPETGLAELNDADVPLTKFRVYATLAYKGDVEALVREILRDRDGVGA